MRHSFSVGASQPASGLYPLGDSEPDRLRELQAYAIWETPPEPAFDRITLLASRFFRAPIALLSFLSKDTQWFKSKIGIDLNETPRGISFCTWAILTPDVMVVPDATADARFDCNPVVTKSGGIRFYAGAPLLTPRGYNLGTLCVMDDKPRPEGLSPEERQTLRELAAAVINELEVRLSLTHLDLARQAEREALARASFLAGLVENSNDAVVAVNRDQVISFWNAAAERLFGYTSEEIVGKPLSVMAPPERADEPGVLFSRALAGEATVNAETTRLAKNGRIVDISLTVSPICEPAGAVIGVSGIARDITERKRADAERRRATELLEVQAQELARSNDDLQQFAYVSSHDLKEPLRTITSFAQMLSRRYSGRLDQEADEFIAFILSGTKRMQELIDALLNYSRVVNAEPLPAKPVRISDVLQWSLLNLQGLLREARAHVAYDEWLPVVSGDSTQLVQLFQNLIGNAARYRGEEAPEIRVSAEKYDENFWLFAVRDNGIGISKEHVDRIFGVFKRLHGREVPGTGIGLAICKRIVEKHGGRIWVISEPGAGSTFHFTLRDALGRKAAGAAISKAAST